jgi:hypothetical protein
VLAPPFYAARSMAEGRIRSNRSSLVATKNSNFVQVGQVRFGWIKRHTSCVAEGHWERAGLSARSLTLWLSRLHSFRTKVSTSVRVPARRPLRKSWSLWRRNSAHRY